MDTRIAEYMIAIYEERKLTSAAKRLFITESALNQQVKKLERELGTALFERGKKGLVLTDAGKIYISGAYTSLRIKERAMKQIEQICAGAKDNSKIRVSFHHTFSHFFAHRIRPDFEDIYPDISLEAVTVRDTPARTQVLEDNADIAIILSMQSGLPNLKTIPIRHEELHLAFPAKLISSMPETSEYFDIWGCLRTQKLISAPPKSFFAQAEQKYLNRAGLHPETICQAATMQDFRFLLNQQFAMGLIPLSLITESDQFRHIPLEPAAYYYLQIAYKEELAFTPALRELLLIILRAFDSDHLNNAILSAFR